MRVLTGRSGRSYPKSAAVLALALLAVSIADAEGEARGRVVTLRQTPVPFARVVLHDRHRFFARLAISPLNVIFNLLSSHTLSLMDNESEVSAGTPSVGAITDWSHWGKQSP